MTLLIGIYGASGFGREVFEVVKCQSDAIGARIVFVDDANNQSALFAENELFDWKTFLCQPENNKAIVIAVADGFIRARLADRCTDDGIKLWSVRANNSFSAQQAIIADGAILQPFVTLTSNVRIGRCFHANIYSYVAHDCEIGNFVTFAPHVMCNGNVKIEDHVYIGTGAILRQGTPDRPLTIGRNAIIGMGAVVTKDVPAGITVVGNPARPIQKS